MAKRRRRRKTKNKGVKIFGLIVFIISAVLLTLTMKNLIDAQNEREAANDRLEIMQAETAELEFFASNRPNKGNGGSTGSSTDFYEKIKSGQSVNILFLGNCSARGEYGWISRGASSLAARYNVALGGGNYTNLGSDSFLGYYLMNSNMKGLTYDLVVVVFGHGEDTENFRVNYDGLFRSIKENNQKCEIIAVIEADKNGYNANVDSVREICDHYGASVIDMVQYFKENKVDYKSSTSDGRTLTYNGCNHYIDAFLSTIETNIIEGKTVDPVTEGVYSTSECFADFQFIPVSQMTKAGENAVEIKTNAKMVNLIYYDNYAGGDITLFVNGKKVEGFRNVGVQNTARSLNRRLVSQNLNGINTIRINFGKSDNISNIKGIVIGG